MIHKNPVFKPLFIYIILRREFPESRKSRQRCYWLGRLPCSRWCVSPAGALRWVTWLVRIVAATTGCLWKERKVSAIFQYHCLRLVSRNTLLSTEDTTPSSAAFPRVLLLYLHSKRASTECPCVRETAALRFPKVHIYISYVTVWRWHPRCCGIRYGGSREL